MRSNTKPKIRAECHSDDYKVEVDFDAVRWFRQASDKEILELSGCDWGGDYPADAVARFFRRSSTKRLFDYLDFKPRMLNGDPCGFECHVDKTNALAWIRKNRSMLLANLEDKA